MTSWKIIRKPPNSALLFYLLILCGSSIPGKEIPKIVQLTPDKLLHLGEYTVFGFLLMRWFVQYAWSTRKTMLLVLLLGMTFAALDECYQRLIPNRSSDYRDWLIDVLGVLLGAFLYTRFFKKKSITL